MAKIAGIDYGAKLSGNTALAHQQEGSVYFSQCAKKKDADAWLKSEIASLKATVIYLDAPLSLPGAYFGKGDNFHFRKADLAVKAMSPMFLGGLTARAIKLKSELSTTTFHEIYPAYYQSHFVQSVHYKKDIKQFLADLVNVESFRMHKSPENWHQVDALLALLISRRHQENRHVELGDQNEGTMIV